MKKFISSKKIVSVVLTGVLIVLTPMTAMAAALSDLSDEMSTLKKSTLSSHQIQFVTPTGVESNTDTIIFTFQSDFAIGGLSLTDLDLAEGNSSCSSFSELTVAASPGADTWGFATTSSSITLTAPSSGSTGYVAAGDCIQLQIGSSAAGGTNVVTNPSTAGSKTIGISGAFGDSGTTTVEILDDDQVQLTAEVPQSITFSISANSASFGNLSASDDRFATAAGGNSSETSAHTLTAGTNASTGYVLTVEGDTLTSGGNTITAIGGTAASSTLGSEQFGMRVTASGGSGAVSAPYNQSTSYAYAASAGTTDEVASATGSTANTTYTVYYVANIASNTEAGSYTAALTYVATANY
jgi:hypothetical protein